MLEFASDDPFAARALEAMYHAAPPTAATPALRYTLRRATSADGGYVAVTPARALYGPAPLADAWAFVEWRATEDLLHGATAGIAFLHAGGAVIGDRLLLIVGDSGAGKSTLLAHLLLRGHRAIGDDVVRFATADGTFSAVGRSLKLDDKALARMPLLAARCAHAAIGTLLAPGCCYMSPAAIRRDWEAAPTRPWAVVTLDGSTHAGPGLVRRSSEGEAAVGVTQRILGLATGREERDDVAGALLESLSDAAAYRAEGAEPWAVAAALEREASR